MKEENLKYIRAPIVNSYQSNKILINTDVIIKVSRTKVYIRAPRCGYKLLGSILEKKERPINNY
jgi:hypothetical protein